MPTLACAFCSAPVYAATEGAARILCAACAPKAKTPFDSLPTWPGAHNMMADDDDEAEEDGDEEEEKPKSKKSKGGDDDDGEDDGKFSTKPGSGKKSKSKSKSDDDDDDDDRPKKKKRREEAESSKGGLGMGMILGIVGVLVVCCVCVPIGGGLSFMLIGGVQTKDGVKDGAQAKDGAPKDCGATDGGKDGLQAAAARINSTNNLKQIGLAFHSFHDANKRLPFNGSNDQVGAFKYSKAARANTFTSGSWAFQILPYIDQGPMFNTVDKTKPVPAYMCPGRGRPQLEAGEGAWTDYFINNYINNSMAPASLEAFDQKRTLVGITDGTSNTIFVGHGNIATGEYTQEKFVAGSRNIFLGGTDGTARSGPVGGPNPAGMLLAKDSVTRPGYANWGGPFSQGGLMAMGDATVRTFPYTTANFGAFLTPTGNENVVLPIE